MLYRISQGQHDSVSKQRSFFATKIRFFQIKKHLKYAIILAAYFGPFIGRKNKFISNEWELKVQHDY